MLVVHLDGSRTFAHIGMAASFDGAIDLNAFIASQSALHSIVLAASSA
jgi:hypothetical protein